MTEPVTNHPQAFTIAGSKFPNTDAGLAPGEKLEVIPLQAHQEEVERLEEKVAHIATNFRGPGPMDEPADSGPVAALIKQHRAEIASLKEELERKESSLDWWAEKVEKVRAELETVKEEKQAFVKLFDQAHKELLESNRRAEKAEAELAREKEKNA